ncbi:MAG: DNA repair protein RecN [Chloroflexi bacterium]|nr:DNA repair protein RecN [Chloroflexota bacterium]MCL5274115.1 DNA repair protein RecN [Chloroflexota bacterium]
MLTELRVRDFAIIDSLNIEFANGFNVLTGETGAGKSIIVDSIALLLGDRAGAGSVRTGAERALIEGVFTLDEAVRREVEAILTEQGLESDEPGQLLLGREVRVNGRTLCRVNGRAVGQNVLRELGELLMDVHGQSEHLSLLRVKEHVNLLDRYANLWDLRQGVTAKVAELRATRKEMQQLIDSARERARRVDMLKFQLEEIRSAKLKPNEETILQDEHTRLANAETLAMYAEEANSALYESSREQPAALDQIEQASRALTNLARFDKQFDDYGKSLAEASAIVQEIARTLQEYREAIEFNPRRLQQVEERLSLIKKLKRKYGDTVDAVIAFAERAENELNQIENSAERIETLQADEARLAGELAKLAVELSARRCAAAGQLSQQVEAELEDLRMAGARFAVSITQEEDKSGIEINRTGEIRDWRLEIKPGASQSPISNLQSQSKDSKARIRFDATGIDVVEFMIAPNVGEGLKPLVKTASGGETARLMLALKTVLSRADHTPSLIFDEIDQGIGGRVGASVGQKLWALTRSHQVFCITHLPQLASFGDSHYKVEKTAHADRTVTSVHRLSHDERLDELAQMLGTTGKTGRQGAEQLVKEAGETKKNAASA